MLRRTEKARRGENPSGPVQGRKQSAAYRSGPSGDWIKVKNPDSPAMRRHRAGSLVAGSKTKKAPASPGLLEREPVGGWGVPSSHSLVG
jgi:hypothetical protein